MAIPPNDPPMNEDVVFDTTTNSDEKKKIQTIDQAVDGNLLSTENEGKNFVEEPIQVAMLGKGKVTKTIIDAGKKIIKETDEFLTKDPKDGVNVNKPPISKEKVQEGDPLAKMDTEGNIFVRPLRIEEVESLQEYVFREDPDLKDIDLKLLNLGEIETGFKENGNLDLTLKSMMKKVYDTYKDEKLGGKKLRVEPKKLTKVETEVDGSKTFIKEGGVSFSEMLDEANKISSTDALIMMLQRKPGDRPFRYDEMIAARKTALSFEILIYRQLKKYKETGSVVDLAKLQQSIGLYAYATMNLAGSNSDLARGLVSQKIIAQPSQSYQNNLKNMMDSHLPGSVVPGADPVNTLLPNGSFIIDEKNAQAYLDQNGGEINAKILVDKFLKLPRDGTRTKFAQGWLKSKVKVTSSALVELYQTSLLSSITTHSFNTAGQMAFMTLVPFERMLSGEVMEALTMYKAMAKYFPQALKGFSYALIHEKSMVDNVSKLDVNERAITGSAFGLKKGEGFTENALSYSVDFFGVFMRAFGYRPMMAIDEFFKATSRGMEIEAIAFRSKRETYKSIMQQYAEDPNMINPDTKKPFKDFYEAQDYAKSQSQVQFEKTRNSQNTFNEASEFARMITFQDDLPESFNTIGRVINNPIAKIWIPFYKTPTQIVRRVMERSPIFGPLMPSVREKIMKGTPRERNEAIARMVGLSSIFATGMWMASGSGGDDVIITGYGPTDPKLRATWLESNIPYSIGVKKDDGSYEYISYARYDPISGVLAAMADAKDVVYNLDNEKDISDIILYGAASTFKYVGTALPMTQFLGELTRVIGGNYESTEAKIKRIKELMAEQVLTAGITVKEHVTSGGVFMPPQLSGNFERVLSPNASNTLPDNNYVDGPGGQGVMRAYYKALNKICSKTVGCSSTLPSKKNRWYEEVPQTGGKGWEIYSPIKVRKFPKKKMINAELEKLKYGLPYLSPNPEPMIKLNAQQYDRYIELYNYPERSKFSRKAFGVDLNPGVNTVPMPLLERFALAIDPKNEEYHKMRHPADITQRISATPKHKAAYLDDIHYDYKKYALKLLYLEYPELRALKEQRDAFREENIKNPDKLDDPSGAAIERAHEKNLRELFIDNDNPSLQR